MGYNHAFIIIFFTFSVYIFFNRYKQAKVKISKNVKENIDKKECNVNSNLDDILKGLNVKLEFLLSKGDVNSIRELLNYKERINELYEECIRLDIGDRKYMKRKVLNIVSKLDKANKSDWLCWIRGYIKNGGEITHFYDYGFYRHDWYLIREDFIFDIDAYGANSFNVIVMPGINVTIKKMGHCQIYFMDDFKMEGNIEFVPCYSNTIP